MSRLAMFLVHIPDHNLLIPATSGLSAVPGLISWQAVDGPINLVATVEGSSDPLLDHLNATAGHVTVTMCEILRPSGEQIGPAITSNLCQAWVFADVDSAKKEAVRISLAATSGVTDICETRGGCDLVALVSGKSLDEVDRIIGRDIQPLDGLLRLKKHRIINLTSL